MELVDAAGASIVLTAILLNKQVQLAALLASQIIVALGHSCGSLVLSALVPIFPKVRPVKPGSAIAAVIGVVIERAALQVCVDHLDWLIVLLHAVVLLL